MFQHYSSIFDMEHYSKGWKMIQYDNRPLSTIDEMFTIMNQEYCKKNGIEYELVSKPFDLPPYWTKVQLAIDTLKECYEGVMWIDTDAVVVKNKPIQAFFDGHHDMVCSPDSNVWAMVSPFNAGIWMVKKSGLDILHKWMSTYNKDNWTFDGTKWHSNGIWAGDTYEQGSFSKHILPVYQDRIKIVSWNVFQDIRKTEDAFTLHFSDNQKIFREPFLEQTPY
jgi:hypothetical protein